MSKPRPAARSADHNAGVDHLLSVAEAAASVGVSRSTVSRAIRAGRLAATRTGRAFRIRPTDIQAWRHDWSATGRVPAQRLSMRRPEPNPETSLPDDALRDLAELLGSPDEILTALCDRLTYGDPGVTAQIWVQDRDRRGFSVLASSETAPVEARRRLNLRRDGATIAGLATTWRRVRLSGLAASPADGDAIPAWAVALRREGRLAGFITVHGTGLIAETEPDDDPWREALAQLAGWALGLLEQQHTAATRAEQLRATVMAFAEAAAIVDVDGRIHLANPPFRALFGLAPEALDVGVNLMTLVDHAERAADRQQACLKRSLVGRLRQALAAGTPSLLPMAFLPGSDDRQGPGRMLISPVHEGAVEDGARFGALVRVSSVRPNAAAARDGRSGRPAGPTVEIERLVDLVTALGRGQRLEDTLAAGVEEMISLFDATAGSVLLRRSNGLLVRLAPQGFRDAAMLVGEEDTDATPVIRRVVESRQAELLRRSAADGEDLMALNEVESDAALVIPLIVREQVVGVISLLFFAEPAVLPEAEVELATALGRYLAVAISNARNRERWGETRERLRTIIEQLPQGVVAVDAATGKLSLANAAAESLWGGVLTGTEEVDDDPPEYLIAPRDLDPFPDALAALPMADADGRPLADEDAPLARTLRTGERRIGERLIVRRPDGSIVPVIGNHAPMLDGDRILGAISVLQSVDQLAADPSAIPRQSANAPFVQPSLSSLVDTLPTLIQEVRDRDATDSLDVAARLDRLATATERLSDLIEQLTGGASERAPGGLWQE